jgi:saccharopine dehydrogenase-like NADP-dependent oxidoreductase
VIVVVVGTGNIGRDVEHGLCERGEEIRVFAGSRQAVPDGVESRDWGLWWRMAAWISDCATGSTS